MITKEFLEKSLNLTDLIEASYQELKDLREMSDNIKGVSFDKVGGKSGTSQNEAGFTKTIDKIVDLEEAINRDIATMVDNLGIIREAINEVPNNNEKLVLKLRYLSHFTWQEISDKTGYSVMQLHRIHKKALGNFK